MWHLFCHDLFPISSSFPSKDTTWQQHCYNIAAMSQHCSEIVTMLLPCCVFAGLVLLERLCFVIVAFPGLNSLISF